MGRPRKPTKLLLLGGAARKHPERIAAREHEPEPESGLGQPPDTFDESERARWAELIDIVPAGVLTRMDRPMAALLCRLWAKSERREASAAQERLLASLSGKFGLTPSDRSKVSAAGPRKKQANPFEQLG